MERLGTGLPLAPTDPATYYQGDSGYLTYPLLRASAALSIPGISARKVRLVTEA
ncbi:hypothetical protein [Streptomyces mirabilis]|uniref:hypothetical protein n=1 Tax=Streptomyces mirabilis TaxID=68239 RepID=UPI0036A8844D